MSSFPHRESAEAAVPKPLAGKIALVTGASRGIGAAAARAFAEAGATVILTARTADTLDGVAQGIQRDGATARAIVADVADVASVDRLFGSIAEEFGRLDIAFNNAGAGNLPIEIADLHVDAFDACIAQNLRSVFLCMRRELQAMLATGGAIVNMSSSAGLEGVRGLSAYSAAKHGVIGLTKSAAREYGMKDIRVNALAPGPILTERLAAAPRQVRDNVAGAIPMRRLGTPDEVAAAAVWLAGDAATFINGAVLTIDGGKLAGQS